MPAPESTTAVRRRYGWVASIYDWANLEGALYADARARAIELLDLRPGARVLDVACGTGANFALIERRIGPSGQLVGVDVTPQMLHRAGARVTRAGWSNVRLREGDVCELWPECRTEPFDAAVCTLGLSVIPRPLAWALSRLFAGDCSRRPWRLLQRETDDPTSEPFTWGWVTAAAGAKGTV